MIEQISCHVEDKMISLLDENVCEREKRRIFDINIYPITQIMFFFCRNILQTLNEFMI